MSINTTKADVYVNWEKFFDTSDIKILFFLRDNRDARFSDLLKFMETSKRSNKRSMLSRSLRDLQNRRLVERMVEQTRPVQTKYRLTENGRRAVQSLNELQKMVS